MSGVIFCEVLLLQGGVAMTIHYKDYVDKLILLEEKLGYKVGYEILEPNSVALTSDIVSIQAAAKDIARFLGLGKYRFIVGMTGKDGKVAGEIELRHGLTEVFIELSNNVVKHTMAIPAVLSHEIMHQYLLVSGISFSDDHENEVLTDIAAVFLGLGKLMLNGAVTVLKQEDASYTLKLGYLTREQLAYVYLLVCSMRGIPYTTYEAGLSKDVIALLRQTMNHYKDHFSLAVPHADYSDLHLAVGNSKIVELQQQLRAIQVHHDVVKKALEHELEVWQESHNMAKKWLQSIALPDMKKEEHNPALRYLRHLRFNVDMDQLDGLASERIGKVTHSRHKFEELRRFVAQHFKTDSSLAPDSLFCPIDGSEIEIDSRSEVAVCMDCGYRFSVRFRGWNKKSSVRDKARSNRTRKSRNRDRRQIIEGLAFCIAVALPFLFALFGYLSSLR